MCTTARAAWIAISGDQDHSASPSCARGLPIFAHAASIAASAAAPLAGTARFQSRAAITSISGNRLDTAASSALPKCPPAASASPRFAATWPNTPWPCARSMCLMQRCSGDTRMRAASAASSSRPSPEEHGGRQAEHAHVQHRAYRLVALVLRNGRRSRDPRTDFGVRRGALGRRRVQQEPLQHGVCILVKTGKLEGCERQVVQSEALVTPRKPHRSEHSAGLGWPADGHKQLASMPDQHDFGRICQAIARVRQVQLLKICDRVLRPLKKRRNAAEIQRQDARGTSPHMQCLTRSSTR